MFKKLNLKYEKDILKFWKSNFKIKDYSRSIENRIVTSKNMIYSLVEYYFSSV